MSKKGPTKKEFFILCDIEDYGAKEILENHNRFEEYEKLVAKGYLKKTKLPGLMYEWKYELSEKGKKYMKATE